MRVSVLPHSWSCPAALSQHSGSPAVLWWPGRTRQRATHNLLITLEILQEQPEQSHVLQETSGTILREQRYAEAEVLASFHSVPHGREENYEHVYPI